MLHVCRKCGIELISGINFTPSYAKQWNWICRKCHNERVKGHWKINRERMRETSRLHYLKNREKLLEKSKKRQAFKLEKLREEILELLGNKCSNPNCSVVGGMSDSRALQIDHINGGGCKERKKLSIIPYYQHILQSIRKGEEKYQLLCANCNVIKR